MDQKPFHIKNVLKEVIRDLGGKRRLKQQQTITSVWKEVIGKNLAPHTQVVGIKQKVIQVKVDSAPLLNELAHFKKQEILSKIQEKLPHGYIGDIKFIA